MKRRMLLSRLVHIENMPRDALAQCLIELVQHIAESANKYGQATLDAADITELIDEHLTT